MNHELALEVSIHGFVHQQCCDGLRTWPGADDCFQQVEIAPSQEGKVCWSCHATCSTWPAAPYLCKVLSQLCCGRAVIHVEVVAQTPEPRGGFRWLQSQCLHSSRMGAGALEVCSCQHLEIEG
eukprot:3366010-Amphidinium_carterae.1